MFCSDERLGRLISTWLHFQETIIFQGKLIQVHMYAVVIILCNRTYVTKNSKDTALNLTSNRGFRGRLTLTEDILVDYQY